MKEMLLNLIDKIDSDKDSDDDSLFFTKKELEVLKNNMEDEEVYTKIYIDI